MKRLDKIVLFLVCVLSTFSAFANEAVNFTASAPDVVPNGSPFQLVYTVNASSKDLRVPEMPDFDVVAGPFTSQSRSMQIVNGNMSSTVTIRYTYTLVPKKEGTFTIAAASIVVDKQKYQSNSLSIKVLPAEETTSTQQSSANNNQQVTVSQQITNENLFILPIVSRYKIREQEYTLVTYKIYSKVDLVDIQSPKFPDFKGFMVQEIDLPQNKRISLENYKGKNYNTVILRQYLLYPQKSGTLKIDPMTCDAVVRVRSQARVQSIFDNFFDSYQDIKKSLSTVAVKIDVSPLPAPVPTDFSGGVGKFTLSSNINKTELETNESLTVQLKISGNGNMKMIKNPALKFPPDFEVYEPKVSNDFSNTTSGVTGTKTIEYLAIPRHAGKFTIPAMSFSYFDVASQSYKTLTTPTYELEVKKGSSASGGVVNNFTNKEQVQLLASDIRYISVDDFEIKPLSSFFFGTWQFWFWLIAPLLMTVLLIVFFRKKARENADLALMRNKKANKVARKRLKVAAKNLKIGNKEIFYNEVLKALWGYVCDKLSMPLADLNKENVASRLRDRNVTDEKIAEFIELLNDCEFARYAPAEDVKEMDKVYEKTMTLITELEQMIKK